MREVDQLEDPVDQGEADRPEGVDRPQREAGEAGLGDVVEPLGDDHREDGGGEDRQRDQRRTLARRVPNPVGERLFARG